MKDFYLESLGQKCGCALYTAKYGIYQQTQAHPLGRSPPPSRVRGTAVRHRSFSGTPYTAIVVLSAATNGGNTQKQMLSSAISLPKSLLITIICYRCPHLNKS